MKFIDICAGIGGFRLGLEQAGHECVGFVEFNKFAVASYRAMYNTEGEFYHDDITTIRTNDIPKADAWCFGFPCQDISVAGKQKGLDGSRSGIYFDIINLVKSKNEEGKPRWLLIENVKNLLSIDNGWGFARVLFELDEAGYDAEWQLLNSKNFGVPQNRERVFIVGHLRNRSGGKVFPIGRSDKESNNEIIVSGYVRPSKIKDRTRILDTNGICQGLRATNYKDPPKINVVKQIGNIGKSESFGGNPISGINPSCLRIAPTLTTCGGGNLEPKILCSKDMRIGKIQPKDRDYNKKGRQREEVIEYRSDNVAPSCLANVNTTVVSNGFRIRKLTPKECFRLQGFPDEYFERAASVNSNSQLYKQAGNAVTVNVTYEIGKKLMEIEKING